MRAKLHFSFLLCAALAAVSMGAPARAGDAQTTQPDPRFRVTTGTDVRGQTVLTVQNASSLSITGLLAFGSEGRVTSLRVFDSVMNQPFERAIAPGQSHALVVFGPRRPGQPAPQVALEAVIFSDGSAWGDTTYIQKLLRLRGLAYEYAEQALALVQEGRKQGLSCEQLASEAEQVAKEKVQAAHGLDERIIAQHAYDVISLPLRSSGSVCGTGPIPDILYNVVSNRLLSDIGALEHAKPSVVSAQP